MPVSQSTTALRETTCEVVDIKGTLQSHLDAILKIEAASFAPPWSKDNFLDFADQNKPHLCALGVTINGQLSGYLFYSSYSHAIQIDNIAVSENHRRREVGTLLIKALEEIALETTHRQIQAVAGISNTSAREFFTESGFKILNICDGSAFRATEEQYHFNRTLKEDYPRPALVALNLSDSLPIIPKGLKQLSRRLEDPNLDPLVRDNFKQIIAEYNEIAPNLTNQDPTVERRLKNHVFNFICSQRTWYDFLKLQTKTLKPLPENLPSAPQSYLNKETQTNLFKSSLAEFVADLESRLTSNLPIYDIHEFTNLLGLFRSPFLSPSPIPPDLLSRIAQVAAKGLAYGKIPTEDGLKLLSGVLNLSTPIDCCKILANLPEAFLPLNQETYELLRNAGFDLGQISLDTDAPNNNSLQDAINPSQADPRVVLGFIRGRLAKITVHKQVLRQTTLDTLTTDLLSLTNQLFKRISDDCLLKTLYGIPLTRQFIPYALANAETYPSKLQEMFADTLAQIIKLFDWSEWGINLLEAIAPADAPHRSPARAALLRKIIGDTKIIEATKLDNLNSSQLNTRTNLLPLLQSILRQELRSSAANSDTILNSLRLIKAIGPCDAATDLTPEIATLAGVPVFSVGRAIGSLLGSRFFRVPWGRKRELPDEVKLAAKETFETLNVELLCGPGIIEKLKIS